MREYEKCGCYYEAGSRHTCADCMSKTPNPDGGIRMSVAEHLGEKTYFIVSPCFDSTGDYQAFKDEHEALEDAKQSLERQWDQLEVGEIATVSIRLQESDTWANEPDDSKDVLLAEVNRLTRELAEMKTHYATCQLSLDNTHAQLREQRETNRILKEMQDWEEAARGNLEAQLAEKSKMLDKMAGALEVTSKFMEAVNHFTDWEETDTGPIGDMSTGIKNRASSLNELLTEYRSVKR